MSGGGEVGGADGGTVAVGEALASLELPAFHGRARGLPLSVRRAIQREAGTLLVELAADVTGEMATSHSRPGSGDDALAAQRVCWRKMKVRELRALSLFADSLLRDLVPLQTVSEEEILVLAARYRDLLASLDAPGQVEGVCGERDPLLAQRLAGGGSRELVAPLRRVAEGCQASIRVAARILPRGVREDAIDEFVDEVQTAYALGRPVVARSISIIVRSLLPLAWRARRTRRRGI